MGDKADGALDGAGVAAVIAGTGIRGGAIGVQVREAHAAGGGANQQARGLQQSGFAGAIGANQRDAFAGSDGERDAAQGKARAVAFREVDEFEAQSAGRACCGAGVLNARRFCGRWGAGARLHGGG